MNTKNAIEALTQAKPEVKRRVMEIIRKLEHCEHQSVDFDEFFIELEKSGIWCLQDNNKTVYITEIHEIIVFLIAHFDCIYTVKKNKEKSMAELQEIISAVDKS